EGVLGVEADAKPLAPARLRAEPPELREAPADLRPLSGRILERDGGGEAAAGLQHLAERARRGAEPRVLARTAVRAGMRNQVRDAEALAALELARGLGSVGGLVGDRRLVDRDSRFAGRHRPEGLC